MSILMIGLYVAYVVVVFYQDRLAEKDANTEAAKKAKLASDMTELNNLERFGQKPIANDSNKGEMSYDFEKQFS